MGCTAGRFCTLSIFPSTGSARHNGVPAIRARGVACRLGRGNRHRKAGHMETAAGLRMIHPVLHTVQAPGGVGARVPFPALLRTGVLGDSLGKGCNLRRTLSCPDGLIDVNILTLSYPKQYLHYFT